uniref:CitMHS domain-containing protein n=1 Tax=Steinernema glaseri TaxID=37863 RepID=A0A1I7Z829_9BILA
MENGSPVAVGETSPKTLTTVKNFFRYFKDEAIIILTPLICSIVLFLFPNHVIEARCAFTVLVMEVYWVSEVLPLPVTAFIPMVLFPTFGIMKSVDVARTYLADTNFLFLGGLIFAVAVERCNLHQRIALFVLSIVGSQPKFILLGFVLCTGFLSLWISNTAITALMLPIALSVSAELAEFNKDEEMCAMNENGEKLGEAAPLSASKKDLANTLNEQDLKMTKALLLGVAFSSSIGGLGTMVGTATNLVFFGQMPKLYPEATNTGINFFSWMLFASPIVIIGLILCWAILGLLFLRNSPPGNPRISAMLKDKYLNLPEVSFAEKSVAIFFFILLGLWVCREPQIFPGFALFFKKGYITDATSAMIIVLVLFAFPDKKPEITGAKKIVKTRLLDWKTVQSRVPWSVILLLGGGFAMAAGVKESKLSARIGEMLTILDVLHPMAIMSICIAISVFVTNICANTVTASIFLPIAAEMATSLKIHPLYFMLPITIAASFAFALPVATPPNAIIFASGLVKVNDLVVSGTILSILLGIVTIFVVQFWGTLVFGLSTFPAWAEAAGNVTGATF